MFLGSGAARGLLRRMGRVQTSNDEATAMLSSRRTSVTGAEGGGGYGSSVTQPLLPKKESPVSSHFHNPIRTMFSFSFVLA